VDRLHALIIVVALAAMAGGAGCDDATDVAPPSRVVAVAAEPNAGPNVDEFCDVTGSGAEAPLMAFPALAGPAPAKVRSVRWVNVWATWCAPCVEEIPRLVRFRDRLEAEGTAVDLVFLSADQDDEAVAAFRANHDALPEGPRIADPTSLPAWAASIGLDEGATLPIHVFADASGHVRCARTGGVGDDHYDVVKAIAAR
jgi:thiol-disulfide isomerase/thioredoxin